jgi:hypothetical protein
MWRDHYTMTTQCKACINNIGAALYQVQDGMFVQSAMRQKGFESLKTVMAMPNMSEANNSRIALV